MGDHDNGGAHLLVHALQGAQQHLAGVAVQSPGGLIGQDELGVVYHGPGAGAPLLLAAGDLIGELGQDVPDVQGVRHLLDLPINLAGRDLVDGEGQGDVFPHGKGVQEVEVLKDKP